MKTAEIICARVAHALSELGVKAGERLGVGCSGGPDSAALADIVLALCERGLIGPALILHVDHGLRPGSADDAACARALAKPYGADVAVLPVVVNKTGGSLERAARDARYQAFERAAAAFGLRWILLAHTASDQAETVLMRMLRGTGVVGLAGIPPRRGIYLRPLLTTTRPDIEAYVAERGLPVVRDPMNDDPAYARNRIRHHWLPALREENPQLDRALCTLADAAREEREVLDFAARLVLDEARRDAALGERGINEPGPESSGSAPAAADALVLHVTPLRRAPVAVSRRALALAAEEAGGQPLLARHLHALEDLIAGELGGSATLDLAGLKARREYDRLVLAQVLREEETVDISAVSVTGPHPPYEVRQYRPGDRMRPERLRGKSRKLSDLYTDAKVPRRLRPHALVVVRQRDSEIVWAQHIGPAFASGVDVVLTRPHRAASN